MDTTAFAGVNRPLEMVINANLPLRTLNEYYPETTTALQEYGRVMQQRFTASNPSECEICRVKPGPVTQLYAWHTMVNPEFTFTKLDMLMLFLGRAGVTLKQTVIQFETAHGLCPSCVTAIKTRRTLSVAVKAVAFFLLVVCLALAVIGGGGVLYSLKKTGTFEAGFALSCGIGAVGLALAYLGHKWESKLRVPAPFRFIGRAPFWLAKVRTA
jgi:hypothetical protein